MWNKWFLPNCTLQVTSSLIHAWKGEVDKTFQKTRVKEFDTVGYIKKAAYFYKILKSEGKEEDNAIFQEVFVPRFYHPTSE